MKKSVILSILAGLWMFSSYPLFAQVTSASALAETVESEWARVHYSKAKNSEKGQKYQELLQKIELELNQSPQSAELWLWKGILTANKAEFAGPFDAMSLIKTAKTFFEKSASLNPKAYYGSAHINLGILYTEVPGGLIGFGDLEKAEQQFLKARTIDPESIDLNFYYGRLMEKKENYQKAKQFYQKALSQKSRPNQSYADDQLKDEVKKQLEELRKKMGEEEPRSLPSKGDL